jgi:hypothetical protein
LKKSDDDERHGGRTYADPSDALLHHATGRDPDELAERFAHLAQVNAFADRAPRAATNGDLPSPDHRLAP